MKRTRQKCSQAKATPRIPELPDFSSDSCILITKDSACNACYRQYVFKPVMKSITIDQLVEQCEPGVKAVLQHCLEQGIDVKAWSTIEIVFQKINFSDGTVEKEDSSYMSTNARPIVIEDSIEKLIDNIKADLGDKIENYTSRGSNWIVADIKTLIVKLVAYDRQGLS